MLVLPGQLDGSVTRGDERAALPATHRCLGGNSRCRTRLQHLCVIKRLVP